MNPWIVVAEVAVLAVVFVMLPVGLAVYSYYRRQRIIRCPVAAVDARVEIDAPRAGWAAAFGREALEVRDCSLWPLREECREVCLRLPARLMREAGAA